MKSLKSNRFSIIPKLLDTATKQIHESIGKRIILYDIKVFSMSKTEWTMDLLHNIFILILFLDAKASLYLPMLG